MPDISLTNYSAYPNVRDTFRTLSDSVGANSANDAEIYNKIMHAIHQTQTHIQHVVRTRGEGGHRKRVTMTDILLVSPAVEFTDTTLQLSAAQYAFLGNQPFRYGNSVLADVYRLDAPGQYVTEFVINTLDTVRVRIRDAQIGTNVAIGTYRVQVTILGS